MLVVFSDSPINNGVSSYGDSEDKGKSIVEMYINLTVKKSGMIDEIVKSCKAFPNAKIYGAIPSVNTGS